MAQRRAPMPQKGYVNRRGAITFCHKMVIGATGAITSQDTDSGLVASRTSAGLYVISVPANPGVGTGPSLGFKKLLDVNIVFVGAAGATTAGLPWTLTNDGTATGTWSVTFVRPDTNAAADVPNPTTLIVNIEVAEGL